jgi:hypothetical protein
VLVVVLPVPQLGEGGACKDDCANGSDECATQNAVKQNCTFIVRPSLMKSTNSIAFPFYSRPLRVASGNEGTR